MERPPGFLTLFSATVKILMERPPIKIIRLRIFLK